MNDDLNSMTREQLQATLTAVQEELADMEDERRFTLGQTGERETKRLNERMATVRDALQAAAPA